MANERDDTATSEDWDDSFEESIPQAPAPWHNSTPAVLGASAIGIVVIAILVAAVSFISGPDDEPPDAPLNFVEPSFSATASRTPTSAPTTTPTITSTAKVSTTDINAPLAPTSSSGTSSSDSSSASRQEEEDEDDATRTTRRTPRTNVTRTLVPRPVG